MTIRTALRDILPKYPQMRLNSSQNRAEQLRRVRITVRPRKIAPPAAPAKDAFAEEMGSMGDVLMEDEDLPF